MKELKYLYLASFWDYEAFENNFDWICPKNLFSDLSEPKRDHKGSSKTYVDETQCLIDKISAVDLNASFKNTSLALSALAQRR
jgi:hypothetical protein